ncbi:MAG: bifunctional phosphopantothenoylcysteine decarboxylase/phosphopantothenate--cysteine ligase CoaBC [Trueperaceae bacterium]|nr:bifunctional phosphopantothenoylcysteine decarboxylase/phosphopantothenate--cysteine ligase CoaBC [Trueperaceae bacterium]
MLLGVTGGLAAIKAPSVVRRLQEAGAEVRVVATARAYAFVTPLSLASVAGHEVLDEAAWFRPDGRARHLSWAHWADVLLVAPATANALSAAATGRADDPVSALVLSVPRTVFAPAMNAAMWGAPAVRRNVATLRGDGHTVLEPAVGPLGTLGEDAGPGRLPDEAVLAGAALRAPRPRDLVGRRVVVSAGPTREWLDPVRFLSNPSSGRMGVAVAEAARDRGAEVTLVCGPTAVPMPHGVEVVRVESAEEMAAALEAPFDACDLLVMTAAVADWRPRARAAEKEPKSGDAKELPLVRTPDVLEALRARRTRQVMVGFAMETDQGVSRAVEKARRKGLAFVALNYPTREGVGFGMSETELTVVGPEGEHEAMGRTTKWEAAERILDRARPLLP